MALFDRRALFGFAAGAATFTVLSLAYSALTSNTSTIRVIRSPSKAVAAISTPYPPTDFIPGARDIDTPYGSIRIYEFGPEDAERKVLLVHGISVPSMALAGMGQRLVDRGCRIMLLDLFGRGYSDAPTDVPYDIRLFTSQILIALSTSSLSWTGQGNRFTIIGYSMGGGIAMSFASYFPALVEDLVLLAPAGLIPVSRVPFLQQLMNAGLLPQRLATSLVARRLKSNPNVSTTSPGGRPTPSAYGREIDAQAILSWQIDNHTGFLPAFVSSFQHAPLKGQHERWRIVGQRLDKQRATKSGGQSDDGDSRGLKAGRVLMVVGQRDDVVHTDSLLVDAKAVLGEQNLDIRSYDAGHEVPVTFVDEIVEFIWSTWKRSGK